MGEGLNQVEDEDEQKQIDSSDRMQALQNFASQSARVPDAKHSKARQKKLLQKLQDELKHENLLLESQLSLAQQNLCQQKKQITQMMKEFNKKSSKVDRGVGTKNEN